jgi:ketosteroid isomerase-like protein
VLARQRAEVADHNIGPSEIESLVVFEVDDHGKPCAAIRFDPDDLAAAYAELDQRYAAGEGARADPLRIPPNAATQAVDGLQDAREAQDWDAYGALCAPALVIDDRRRSILLTGDRDMFIATGRWLASHDVGRTRTLLATAGDRLALERFLWTGATDAPDAEAEALTLTEVDAEGRVVASITFDPDDRRAASAEMYERFVRSDAAGGMPAAGIEFMSTLHDHDLDRVRAQLPDDFFFHDHRRTGAGRLGSADEYLAFVAALFEQSPDVLIEGLYTVAVETHGILDVCHMFGTRDGGDFESVFARIVLHQGDQTVGAELFEVEDLDIARARFEALRSDLTRIPPNAATRAGDRHVEALAVRDWAALRSMVSEDFVFEDRGRWALVSGDVEVWIASATFLVSESAARAERAFLGTVGDRIALQLVAWSGASDEARFELDKIRIIEVDAEGKLRRVILFDADDRGAAFAEAQARFATGEAAEIGGQAPIAALIRALGLHDWEALREALARDAVCSDHRAVSIMGELDREQWIESLRTLADLAPDMGWELFQILAWNGHGRVAAGRLFGTTRDGGPFENAFIAVLLTRGDHVERYEFFDAGDTDRALARFGELCTARVPTRPEAS